MVMNHILHIVDIETAGTEVGGYQHGGGAVVKEIHGEFALALLEPSMVKPYGKSGAAKLVVNAFGALAVVDKHQCAAIGQRTEQGFESGELVALGRIHAHKLHVSAGRFRSGKIKGLRPGEAQEPGHLGQRGRRRKDYQAEMAHLFHDPLHFVVKAEFERLVVFIEHKSRHISEHHCAAAQMVEQTARSGHDNIGHHFHGVHLIGHGVASIESDRLQSLGQRADHVGYLNHQFTRGGHHHRLHTAGRR